jgi:hypothetical protein
MEEILMKDIWEYKYNVKMVKDMWKDDFVEIINEERTRRI